jgi:hypothetical protein
MKTKVSLAVLFGLFPSFFFFNERYLNTDMSSIIEIYSTPTNPILPCTFLMGHIHSSNIRILIAPLLMNGFWSFHSQNTQWIKIFFLSY